MNMRHATEADLPAIVAIYNSAVPTRQSTAVTQEVSVESRIDWFRHHTPDKRPILVYDVGSKVVVWVSFQSFYGWSAYDHTAEISISIVPQCQGRGLGRQLPREAIAMTPALGIQTLVGFVFSHNEPSIRLLCSFGFEEWGKLPNIAEMDGKEYSLSLFGKRINP